MLDSADPPRLYPLQLPRLRMSAWKSLLKERFSTKDGRVEELHILQGSTYFYAGPIFERYRFDGRSMGLTPRFNGMRAEL